MKGINRFIFFINIFFAGLLLLSYLAPFVNPNTFWPIAILGLGYPILLIVNIIFILIWVLTKPLYAILSILSIGIGWKQLYNLYAIPTKTLNTSIELQNSITVASYNIAQLNWVNRLSPTQREEKQAELEAFLHNAKIDIISLQEVSKHNIQEMVNYLEDATYFHHDNYTGIISKYPIIKNGSIKDEKQRTFAVWCDIQKDNFVFRVYSAYLQSNRITGDTDELIKSVENKQPRTWERVKQILGKYKAAIQFRAEDIILLKSHVRDSPNPVILAGDFNDVPHSYIYHQLSQGLFDTFHYARGMQSTYAGKIPLLRIDYILTDQQFEQGSFNRKLVDFSDHYPIISTISY